MSEESEYIRQTKNKVNNFKNDPKISKVARSCNNPATNVGPVGLAAEEINIIKFTNLLDIKSDPNSRISTMVTNVQSITNEAQFHTLNFTVLGDDVVHFDVVFLKVTKRDNFKIEGVRINQTFSIKKNFAGKLKISPAGLLSQLNDCISK